MKENIIKNNLDVTVLGLVAVIFAIIIISSCSSTSQLSSAKVGAQLWGENCMRCHNIPSPETFSDPEWEVAVPHMRVRANLTAEEADKIVKFLKSANLSGS